MKILAAYDGSRSSDALIEDMSKAGLPIKGVELLVMSVAEVWMPPPPTDNGNGNGFEPNEFPVFVNEWAERRLKVAKSAVNEAETLSRHAKAKIAEKFPNWKTSSFFSYGSPAWEILTKADELDADLIIVGSQGRNALGRILLGSVSQKILTEAKCSVRIARSGHNEKSSNRIIIGFDGSKGAELAVEAVTRRNWRKNTEVKLLSAVQSLVPSAIGRFVPPITDWVGEDVKSEKQLVGKLAARSIERLQTAGLKVVLDIHDGNPKEVLVDVAEKWRADSIFMGAHAFANELSKFLVGTTSAAVAERAMCSVEAVRP